MSHRFSRLRQTRRPALTIVELLVATALASMLLVTTMGLLKSLTAKRKALLTEDGPAAGQRSFEEQGETSLTR